MPSAILQFSMEWKRSVLRMVSAAAGSLVLLAGIAGQARAAAGPAEIAQLVDSYAANRDFNGVVLVAQHGRILYRGAHGLANREWQVPNVEDGVFRIGSLSKPITAILVMQLVQENTLRLDGTLGEYLPALYAGTPAAAVTVAQLLNHTSGIADLPRSYEDPWWQTQARLSLAPDDFAKAWIPGTLQSAPGAEWRYNNNGYFLLGLIIEKATGASYEANLQRRILGKAGMTNSGLYSTSALIPRLATGYQTRPDFSLARPMPIDPSVSFSAAGLYSTVDDLLRLDQALQDDSLLSAPSRQAMWTNHRSGYGYGWEVENWPLPAGGSYPVESHTGSVPGYQTYWLRAGQDQSVVIVLDNYWQGETAASLGKELMGVLHGMPVTLARKNLGTLLVPAALSAGVPGMTRAYEALGPSASQYDTSEKALNSLGYRLLRMKRVPESVAVFQWNARAHPQSANVHDSLGEAYRANGQRKQAINSYRTAAALAPNDARLRAVLKELEQE
ncbi:class A beta-lactamase-related serine hydrolase [Stenotrophomonas forensis]|uniref:Serine hydrolase n=1 Tax=Stenotrophomonas forensis TaxID=2871169 RepID=A0ABY7XUM6_9GAMM|nr:class A beta-lactamase-related serine hydrolase [Stenotrophomonas sp. DFS-20110405]WDM61866.1 serine hydrolase [Stenotrophomonas sp. DFS-20110405]